MPRNQLRAGGFKDDQLLDPDLPRLVRYVIYALLVVGLLVAVLPTVALLVVGDPLDRTGLLTWEMALFALAAVPIAMVVSGLVALVGSLAIGLDTRSALYNWVTTTFGPILWFFRLVAATMVH